MNTVVRIVSLPNFSLGESDIKSYHTYQYSHSTPYIGLLQPCIQSYSACSSICDGCSCLTCDDSNKQYPFPSCIYMLMHRTIGQNTLQTTSIHFNFASWCTPLLSLRTCSDACQGTQMHEWLLAWLGMHTGDQEDLASIVHLLTRYLILAHCCSSRIFFIPTYWRNAIMSWLLNDYHKPLQSPFGCRVGNTHSTHYVGCCGDNQPWIKYKMELWSQKLWRCWLATKQAGLLDWWYDAIWCI